MLCFSTLKIKLSFTLVLKIKSYTEIVDFFQSLLLLDTAII